MEDRWGGFSIKPESLYMHFKWFDTSKIKKSYLFLFLGGIIALWLLFLDTYSIWTRYELSQRKEELIHRTQELKKDSQKLQVKIQNLKNDTSLLKRIAREKYGMHKKGETVYKVESEDQ